MIFTSYSTPYVPLMNVQFVEYLASFRPRTVVHFEPIFELLPEDTLLGLMGRRYMQLNDYTRNFLSVMREAEQKKMCKIQKIQANVLGTPFLPFSLIVWKP